MNSHPVLFFLALALSASAEGYRVERTDFFAVNRLETQHLPTLFTPFKLVLSEWNSAKIRAVRRHGSQVKKGDAVIDVHLEEIEVALDEITAKRSLLLLEQEALRAKVKDLEASLPLRQQKLVQQLERAKENVSYFLEIEVPESKKRYERYLEEARWRLKNQQEEYDQLLAMYQEDELTEETEEIILTRQQYAVERAQWEVKEEERRFERATFTTLPRRISDRQAELAQLEIHHVRELSEGPRELREQQLKLSAQAELLSQLAKKEARLRADREAMALQAPHDGIILYGVIRGGRWEDGPTLEKALQPGMTLPKNKFFLCLIQVESPSVLYSQIGAEQWQALEKGERGFFSPSTQGLTKWPVRCEHLDPFPLSNGKYLATFVFDAPPLLDTTLPFPLLAKGEITLPGTVRKNTLVIPRKMLHEEADGTYSVTVLPALDGAPEDQQTPPLPKKQPVSVGTASQEKVEILGGLQEGDLLKEP